MNTRREQSNRFTIFLLLLLMKKYKPGFWLLLFFLFVKNLCFSQTAKDNDLIQFSGIVVTEEGENLKPVSFTNIAVKNTWRGTVSDYYGYFSFVARKKETVIFSAVGYKKVNFTIPDTITTHRYSLIQIMSTDTLLLPETVIYPWPTREQFKQAFVKLHVPEDDMIRAYRNLELMERKEHGILNETTPYLADGGTNYLYYMNSQNDKLYSQGGVTTNNLLNPMAWAEFFKAWKDGKFKKKK
ncbi:MAG: carboxypeptidase-like regulatory domain-containing protein [Lentimicrobiaceae bacterium]|nr:carboxypeptidase-like regulatory domain-containing protein [Lentimicrobiaceae bacterium]